MAAGVTYQPLSRLVSALTYGNTLTEATTWTLDYEQARCVVQDGPTVHVDATLARADGLNVTEASTGPSRPPFSTRRIISI